MTVPYRVLVTGSRYWPAPEAVERALEDARAAMPKGHHLVMVHGDCPTGADAQAKNWARRQTDVQVEAHPAQWGLYGKSAGPLRNQEMVRLGARVCLAFLMHGSRGTQDCVERAWRAGIEVMEFKDHMHVSV